MRKIILLIIIIANSFICLAQSDTTFWFAAPDISSNLNWDRPILLRITAGQQPCNVSISQPALGGMPTQAFSLLSNSTQTIDLTSWISSIECAPGNIIQNKGIKISSDNKVSAYYEVNENGPNSEIFALKGKNALGDEFYISSQYFLDNNTGYSPVPYSSFNIVASEDNTQVTVIPSNDIIGHTANISFTITLNKGQTYAAIATSQAASQHLQGSHVTSTKPVAITLSDDLLLGAPYGGCADLAGDQTVPVNVTGTEYIALRSDLNPPYDKLYITATQNATTVIQDGTLITTLNSGQSAELSMSGNVTYVQTSAPAYAYQLSGYGCEVGSAILPKIDCTGSSLVTVTRSTDVNFILTLLVKNGGQNNFLVNNLAGVITGAEFTVVPGTGGVWYYAKVSLPESQYPSGSVINVSNTTNVFQMGVLKEDALSNAFAYFSDFNSLKATASTNTESVCTGSNILLFGETIASSGYSWTGPGGFTSALQNPVINNASIVNSGKYILTVTIPGCGISKDSVTISIIPKSVATINQSICEGQTYEGYGTSGTYIDIFTGSNGCDSTRTLNLIVKPKSFSTVDQSICEGQTYEGHTTSGTYITVLVAANGCDSVKTLNLTVKPKSFKTLDQSICEGQSYEGYTTTGTYVDNFTGANGCDSIRTLNLTVMPKSFKTLDQSICEGQSYEGYTTTGTYVDIFIGVDGCDSVRTLNLIVKPKSFSTVDQTICEGQSYGGHTTNGTFVDVLVATNGCDSIRTLHLIVKPKSFKTIDQIICKGQSYQGHTSSGTYITTFVAVNGCDSVLTLNLTVKPASVTTINKSICRGQIYEGYNQSGSYIDTLISANGCDSIRTIYLNVEDTLFPDLGPDRAVCSGDTIILSPGVFNNYLWQDGSTNNSFTVKYPGLYSVNVTNSCGSEKDEILVAATTCQIYFPNVFTPNNDGKNDIFNILNAYDLKNYHLAIYNRWGQKIFESDNFRNGWDGNYKGVPADIGTYIWNCDFTSQVAHKMKGTVILLR